jgi:hypothetical protein
VGHRPSFFFSLLLLVHIPAGLICVVTGAIAMLGQKSPGRHPQFGTIYFWGLAVVFVSAALLALLGWSENAHLFVLGCVSFSCGAVGYVARRSRRAGWTSIHILGMGLSYIVLLTAFYVDNGPRLPLWNQLPLLAYWIGPAVIGLPLLARALSRNTNLLEDLRAFSA